MKRTVERLRPAVFVGENVDGISQNFGGAFLDKIAADFGDVGYEVEHRILQAADYGLPQYRRRVFFVGVRRGETSRFSWPRPSHVSKARNGEFEIEDMFKDYVDAPLWAADRDSSLESARPPARTIEDAIGDLLDLESSGVPDHQVTNSWPAEYTHIFRAVKEGQKLCNVRHASTSVCTWDVPEVFGPVSDEEKVVLATISKNRRHRKYGSIPNGNPLTPEVIASLSGLPLTRVVATVPILRGKKYLKEIGGKYDLSGAMFCSGLFKRPAWREPSPTVLTVFDNPRYFLHPLRDRPFSVRECARLQGFSDDFTFCGDTSTKSIRDAYRLIGNAVPPPLASQIAKAVRDLLLGSSRLAEIASSVQA